MAVLNDSIVQGDLRVIGNLYANISGKSTSAVSAEKAASATKALQDDAGNTITSYYKPKQTALTASGGSNTKTITAITQDANGVISPTFANISFPTVNNATVTIQKNGTTVTSFKLNDSTATTANIIVPTGALANSSYANLKTQASADLTAQSARYASNAGNATWANNVSASALSSTTNSAAIWKGLSAQVNSTLGSVYKVQGNSEWSAISGKTSSDYAIGAVFNLTGNSTGITPGDSGSVKAGDNVVMTSAGWDKLGSTYDLSPYQTIAGMSAYSQTGHTHTTGDITNLTAYTGSTALTRAGNLTANSFSASAGSTLAGITANGNFSAKGNVVLSGATTAASNISVSGNVSATGNFSAKGNVTAANVTATNISATSNKGITMSATTGYALTASGNSAKFTNISATTISGVTDVSATNIKADCLSANSLNLNGDASVNTLNANEAVINGAARVLGTLYADTIEGKITSATNADKALDSDKLGNVAASNYVQKNTSVTLTASNATNATNALNVMTQTAANGSAYQATTAMFSGTSAKSALTAYKEIWSLAPNTVNKERPLALSNDNDTIIGGTAGVNGISFNTNITFNSSANRLKVTNLSANTISGTTIYDNGTILTNKFHYGNGGVRYTLGNDDNNASSKYVCIASASVGNWSNLRLVADVLSRHNGNGIVVFNLENNSNQVTNATLSAGSIVNYYGSTTDFFTTDNYHIFVKAANSATGYVYVVTRHQDYSNIGMNILAKHDGIKIASGAATGFAVAADLTAMSTALGGAVDVRTAPLYASMNNHSHSNYVPTGRTVNGQSLSANVSLSLSDLSTSAHSHSFSSYTALANLPSFGTMTGKNSGDYISTAVDSVKWSNVSALTGTGATNLAVGNHTHGYISTAAGSVTFAQVSAITGTGSSNISRGDHTHNYLASVAWKDVSGLTGTGATNLAVGNHTHSNSGSYLSASYSSTTSCTFAGSAASAGVASTAKKASWNQKDDDRNYKVAISLDSEFDYDTPFEYNPASGKLTVPSATKIGGCTMTWNTGTSALDFTF